MTGKDNGKAERITGGPEGKHWQESQTKIGPCMQWKRIVFSM